MKSITKSLVRNLILLPENISYDDNRYSTGASIVNKIVSVITLGYFGKHVYITE